MSITEIVYFFKYIGKKILYTPVNVFYNVKDNLKHPTYVWIYMLFIIYMYQVFIKKQNSFYYNIIMALALLVFLIWREYDAGVWKHELRQKVFASVIKKNEEYNREHQTKKPESETKQ